ncbi:MAG: glycerophosphodiester phosphodiesterase [Spirochaetales bacterium]|nr:glycerophosphodiester phosphodiesterase [Spirochaetales bacterium]
MRPLLPPFRQFFHPSQTPQNHDSAVDLSIPLRFGHRGYSAQAPENTLAAFEALLATDTPGVELDVQMTHDGELVIHHDWTLQRTAGWPQKISESMWSEISSAPVGQWFGKEFANQTLPRLKDLFDLGGKTLYYDIEIKEQKYFNHQLCRALATLIADRGLQDHVLVSSFNPFVLRQFSLVSPSLPRATIYSAHEDVPPILRRGLGRYIAGTPILKPHIPLALEYLGHKTKNRHRPLVMSWTVNTKKEAQDLANQGAWALIGDDPMLLKEALVQR